MCCSHCPRYESCKRAVYLHIHPAYHHPMHNPHYHLCKGIRDCNLDCARCGKLIEEVSRLPAAHYRYGCCHSCPEYTTCKDFPMRHMEDAKRMPRKSLAAHPITEHSIRVLFVENDRTLRNRVAEFFEKDQCFSVRESKNRKEALECVDRFHPHVVMVSLRGSLWEGLEFCKAVRQTHDPKDIRILATAEAASEEDRNEAAASGVDAFLPQATSLDELRHQAQILGQMVMH